MNPNRSREGRFEAIYKVSVRLAETLDLEMLLNTVMDETIEITNAERGFLMLIDPRTGNLEVVAARSFEQESVDDAQEISSSIVERAVTTGEAILTSNALEDPRYSAYQSVVDYRLRSIMCAPLKARGNLIGVAYVDNRFITSVFRQMDLELLVTFANTAALAIDNARLFTQTDQALNRRVDELQVFQQIDHSLNSRLDLRRVLSLSLDWAVQLTGASSGAIGLTQENEDSIVPELNLLAHKGEQQDIDFVVRTNHPVLTQALMTGRAGVSGHQSADGGAVEQLAVPIKKDGDVSGVILLSSATSRPFSPDDRAFVERLADRAAVAIDNSRLYEQIRVAKQTMGDFISVIAHELRSPMTSIMGYTDLLKKEMLGDVNTQQLDVLNVMYSDSERMERLIQDLSDINRLQMGQLKLEFGPFLINELVQKVVKSRRDSIRTKGQRISLMLSKDLPTVNGDKGRTEQILTNLINNANKYTQVGGRLGVRTRLQDGFVAIDVIDNGMGISEEDQARLFEDFFRVDSAEVREQTGWGLGLSIVKNLVDEQGGVIEVRSREGHGSVFTFTVPILPIDDTQESAVVADTEVIEPA